MQNRRKALAKTLSWRILATSDTFLLAWLITGKTSVASAIAGFEIMTKMILYYAHERAWAKAECKVFRSEKLSKRLTFQQNRG